MNTVEKVERNAKAIKAVVGLLVVLAGIIYGFCIFIYQTKECRQKINELNIHIATMDATNNNKHREIDERITQNEKNFQLTATKLDVSLIRISADLQFIKEHLMSKGMDK